MSQVANRYRHITGSKSISGDFDNINETFDMIEDDVVALENKQQTTTQSVNSLQTQINGLVVSGDSSPAAAQAAIDASGHDYKNLKLRLDTEHEQVTAQLADTARGNPGVGYKIIAGVIRNTGTGWAYIEDADHRKTGLSSVEASGYNLTVNYDFMASNVSSLVVTPDETLQQMGINVGASVGKGLAIINMSMPFSGYFKADGSLKNVVTPLAASTEIALKEDGTGFVVTHPPALAINDVPALVVMYEHGNIAGVEVRANWDVNSVHVVAYGEMGGHIAWDGSKWAVSSENIYKPSVSYNQTTGVLTVTHAEVPDPNTLLITDRGTARATVKTSGTTSFEIEFRNPDGSVITGAPNTTMRFFYSRPGVKMLSKMPPTLRVGIRRGNVRIPANNLVSATGNLWIYGIMEK